MNKPKFDQGSIVKEGMGGFLNPPGHPEHTMSVVGYRFSESLSAAVNDENLDPALRAEAKQILDDWEANKPPIDRDWVHSVLGYFRGCYQGNPELGEKSWHVCKLVIV